MYITCILRSGDSCASYEQTNEHQLFSLCILAINPLPNKPWFLRVFSTSLLKTLGKGEIARNEQFSFPHSVFYLFGEHSATFIKL